MILLYDGTYDGLLCAIFDAYAKKLLGDVSIMSKTKLSSTPFCEICVAENDSGHADRVEKKLKNLGADMTVYQAWLSEEEGIEDCILKFIGIALNTGRNPSDRLYDADVKRVVFAARRVSGEAHRYLQFTRFVKASGQEGEPPIYVADIEPLYDILVLIAEHFTKRFADQRFLIRDRARSEALVWDTQRWQIIELPEYARGIPADSEFETLWRDYFKTIAIPWRVNKKLQRQFIPERYRRYLTEFR